MAGRHAEKVCELAARGRARQAVAERGDEDESLWVFAEGGELEPLEEPRERLVDGGAGRAGGGSACDSKWRAQRCGRAGGRARGASAEGSPGAGCAVGLSHLCETSAQRMLSAPSPFQPCVCSKVTWSSQFTNSRSPSRSGRDAASWPASTSSLPPVQHGQRGRIASA